MQTTVSSPLGAEHSRVDLRRRRRRLVVSGVVVGALALVAAGCSSSPTRSSADKDTTATPTADASELVAGSRHKLINESGRFAFAAPRLAKKVTITPSGDGADVRVRVAYDVANSGARAKVLGDRSEVTLRVARSIMSTGPQPNDLVFTSTAKDEKLDRKHPSKDYKFHLPAEAVSFLKSKGVSFEKGRPGSGEGLGLVSVSVQHYRDFQVIDGRADWIHGATFAATQSPTKPSDNPGGALTVRNDTAGGVYTYPSSTLIPVPQQYGPNLYPNPGEWQTASTESEGVPIVLTGQSGSCFYQGTDGSNPNGFNVTLDPGMAVTQTIVADDSKYDLPFTGSEAAALSDAAEIALKAGVTALNTMLSLTFGGPFTLPIALALNVIDVSNGCNNQPNLMHLGAVVGTTGVGANSTMWAAWDGCGGTCGGFANVYSSPWKSDAPTVDATMATEAVQLAPDSNYTYNGKPLWIAQTPLTGCGVGNGKSSNTSGCTSQNLISIRWSDVKPCPYNNGLQPAQGNVLGNGSYCNQPAPSSPEVPSCGTNNAECVSSPD